MEVGTSFAAHAIVVIIAITSSVAVYGIEFSRYPSDKTVEVGDTVTFHCEVIDKGDTHVYWQKNKKVYLSRDRNVTMYAPIHPKFTERLSIVGRNDRYSLRIERVNFHDQGVYQCVYFRKMFSTYTPEARLTVLPKSEQSMSCNSSWGYRRHNDTELTNADNVGANVQLICEEFLVGPERNMSTLYWYRLGEPHRLFESHYCITSSISQKCVYIRTMSARDLDVPYVCTKNGVTKNVNNMCQITPFASDINVTITLVEPIEIGASASYLCSTDMQTNLLQFEWYVNGNPIQYTSNNVVYQWNFNRITLENINMGDNGTTVTCVLHGDNGSLGTGRAVLIIEGNAMTTISHQTSTTPATTTNSSQNITTNYRLFNTSVSPIHASSSGIMSTLSPDLKDYNEVYGVFSPQNAFRDILDSNNTEPSTLEGPMDGTMLIPTFPSTPKDDGSIFEIDGFYMVVALAAVIFAAMCLLVMLNIACYIIYKKHRAYRRRKKNGKKYALNELRSGLDDSVMLDKLSPETERKSKRSGGCGAVSDLSDTDGKRIPSRTSLQLAGRSKDKIEEDSSSESDQDTPLYISSGSEVSNYHTGSSKGSSKRKYSKRKLPSAPPAIVDIESPYRVLDPMRSDSLIESAKQEEREREMEQRRMNLQTLSLSSSECQLSPLPRHREHVVPIETRRKCVSLSHGVLPPWHNPDFDGEDDPAYAVVDLVQENQMRPSRSFCHPRDRSSTPRATDRGLCSRSLRDAVLRKELEQARERPMSIHGVPLRRNPNRSERPVSVQYNGPDRPLAVRFTAGPDSYESYPKYKEFDDQNEAGYDNYRKAPRKPARLPQGTRTSDCDNFRSVKAAGTTHATTKPENVWFPKERRSNLELGHNLSHSETNMSEFSADQPLPITPFSPDSEGSSVFAYPRGERRRTSSEHSQQPDERRLSGEVRDGERSHRLVSRQRSYSDTFSKPPPGALDAITESFSFTVQGSELISSASSSDDTLYTPHDTPSPRLSPVAPARHKVLTRQTNYLEDDAAVRPTSEPVREVDYARVMKSRIYPRLSDDDQGSGGEQVDPVLESFPPYRDDRIHSVSGGTVV